MISSLATKLENFTTTTVRLEPTSGRQIVRPGTIIDFELPSESITNLDTFTLSFDAKPIALNGAAGFARLHAGIETLIEDVSVWCGGVRLDSAGRWFGKRRNLMDGALNVNGDIGSHPRIQRVVDRYAVGGAVAIGALEPVHRYSTNRLGEGFLGCGMIDTSMLPLMTVRVEFTRQHVVAFSNGATATTFLTNTALNPEDYSYEVDDIYAMVEIVGAGSVYDTMQERLMSAKATSLYPSSASLYSRVGTAKPSLCLRQSPSCRNRE
jgi:hypothetical protein